MMRSLLPDAFGPENVSKNWNRFTSKSRGGK
jgi:hypothetical protein